MLAEQCSLMHMPVCALIEACALIRTNRLKVVVLIFSQGKFTLTMDERFKLDGGYIGNCKCFYFALILQDKQYS